MYARSKMQGTADEPPWGVDFRWDRKGYWGRHFLEQFPFFDLRKKNNFLHAASFSVPHKFQHCFHQRLIQKCKTTSEFTAQSVAKYTSRINTSKINDYICTYIHVQCFRSLQQVQSSVWSPYHPSLWGSWLFQPKKNQVLSSDEVQNWVPVDDD